MYDLRECRTSVVAAARWRPEWWVTVVVVLAWVALLAGLGSPSAASAVDEHLQPAGQVTHNNNNNNNNNNHHHHHQDQHEGNLDAAVETHARGHASSGVLAGFSGWALMAVAMMGPVTLPAVRHVGLNSIARRRQWAMTLYFAVYIAIWLAFGAVVLAGEHLLRATFGLDRSFVLAFALALAAGWQLTRVKRRALNACRRTVPLPPVGRRADAGCARFAVRQGSRCVTSCWALMVVMAAVGHSGLVWMTALTALIVVEELTLLRQRLLRQSAALLALAAGLVALGI